MSEGTMKKPTKNISGNNGMGACKRGLLPWTPRKENQIYKVREGPLPMAPFACRCYLVELAARVSALVAAPCVCPRLKTFNPSTLPSLYLKPPTSSTDRPSLLSLPIPYRFPTSTTRLII